MSGHHLEIIFLLVCGFSELIYDWERTFFVNALVLQPTPICGGVWERKIIIMTCVLQAWATTTLLKVNNSRARTHFLRGEEWIFISPWATFFFTLGGSFWIDKMCQINCWIIIFYWLNFIIRTFPFTCVVVVVRWDRYSAASLSLSYGTMKISLFDIFSLRAQLIFLSTAATFTPNPISSSSTSCLACLFAPKA